MRANQPRPIWGEETVTISIRLPRSQRDLLEEIASADGRSRSAVIRGLITAALLAQGDAVAAGPPRPIQAHVLDGRPPRPAPPPPTTAGRRQRGPRSSRKLKARRS